MSQHPIRWLYSQGHLDLDQVQAFDGFLALFERCSGPEYKSCNLGRCLIDAGKARLTPPEASVNARGKIKRALQTINQTERLVLMALVIGKSIAQTESDLGLRPRSAKRFAQNALSTLHAEWPFLDRRKKRGVQIESVNARPPHHSRAGA